jgi:hypothetical protein
MTTSSPTARELISDAGGMPFGDSRRRSLEQALQQLAGEEPADQEARAVALAMLAQQDGRYLPEASSALDQAVSEGVEPDWIWLHLAEAWLAAGDLAEALRYGSAVRRDYFDSRDLHWRSVRMEEIRAVALLGLGRLGEGVQAATAVSAELAQRGDSDDLAPPVQLVRAALALAADPASHATDAGCEVLRALSSSIDLESWFPAELTEEVRQALAGCARAPQ